MPHWPEPTERELEILKVLWERGEASVREVYEVLRPRLGIAQNTVQAFLRIMEEKQLVAHRHEGRTFIYRPLVDRDQTHRRLVGRLLEQAFDGAVDRLVHSALAVRQPSEAELAELEKLLHDARRAARTPRQTRRRT